jgi:hypothetical protein
VAWGRGNTIAGSQTAPVAHIDARCNRNVTVRIGSVALRTHPIPRAYCLKTSGGPLTRFTFRLTVTSTRSAIFMKGMPLFIP